MRRAGMFRFLVYVKRTHPDMPAGGGFMGRSPEDSVRATSILWARKKVGGLLFRQARDGTLRAAPP